MSRYASVRRGVSPRTIPSAQSDTTARVPGPVIRCEKASRRRLTYSTTPIRRLVHWHGLVIPSDRRRRRRGEEPGVPAMATCATGSRPGHRVARFVHTYSAHVRPEPGQYDQDSFWPRMSGRLTHTAEDEEEDPGAKPREPQKTKTERMDIAPALQPSMGSACYGEPCGVKEESACCSTS